MVKYDITFEWQKQRTATGERKKREREGREWKCWSRTDGARSPERCQNGKERIMKRRRKPQKERDIEGPSVSPLIYSVATGKATSICTGSLFDILFQEKKRENKKKKFLYLWQAML